MTVVNSVRETSGVGEARRAAARLAHCSGLADDVVGRIAVVATEMATNLLKHAGGGLVVIDRFADADGSGLEMLALDNGPGMLDVARCLTDGFSTAGSPGTGLGAIVRNSDRHAIYSQPGQGTAVMARIVLSAAAPPGRAEFGAVVDPYPGESVCGDRWAVENDRQGTSLLLVDGSGHGPPAAAAAEIATRAFADNIDKECVPLVEVIHRALAPTRGAAVALARIDAGARLVRFVGVGNIGAVLASGGESRRMASYNGTAGHVAPRIREFTYPFTGRPLVIMHSDGLSARWDINAHPGLAANHPSLVAGVLFRDHRRGRDDAAVVAMRTPS